MIEIERKYLVTSDIFKTQAFNSYKIMQGFLNSHKDRTVRIRIAKDKGYITIKGRSSDNGLSRFEWEKDISLKDAEALLGLCEIGIINKIRYEVKTGNHVVEVDVFFGENEGLIIAEVELDSEDESFEKPDWLGEEITGDIKYYNSQLCKRPFKTWL